MFKGKYFLYYLGMTTLKSQQATINSNWNIASTKPLNLQKRDVETNLTLFKNEKTKIKRNRCLTGFKESHHWHCSLIWINEPSRADPDYLRLHHKMMQANWHQYTECMSMHVWMLNKTYALKGVRMNTYLGYAQLMMY